MIRYKLWITNRKTTLCHHCPK